MKRVFLVFLLVIIFVGCQNTTKSSNRQSFFDFLPKPKITQTQTNQNESLPEIKGEESSLQEATLPSQIDFKVPFVSQAPLQNWDNLHNEACEEASILSIILYLSNQNMTREEMDPELIKMVNWQEENFGGHFDLPIAKVKEFIQSYYSNEGGETSFIKQVDIEYDITIDSIKQELANGNPVIVPLAGREIGNPYFRGLGPVYHMLVIRGYDDKKGEFITNDVGTNSKGEAFRYKYNKIYDNIHDMPEWQQNKDLLDANPKMIFEGRKAMLVIK